MKTSFYSLIFLLALMLQSCDDPIMEDASIPEPNFNYTVSVPEGWTRTDTIMQDLKMRLLFDTASTGHEDARINILISLMEEPDINIFTTNNIEYLRKNREGVTIGERGLIAAGNIRAGWFAYEQTYDGVTREIINYIIPSKGFAYIMTAGVNKGNMDKYRQTFNTIARSFRDEVSTTQ